MASYQYWRVKVTAGTTYTACSTLVFRTAYGGNQAAVGGAAICDSNFSGLPASNAFDTQGTTLWASNGTGTNAWLGYNFGTPVEIVELTWVARRDVSYTQIWSQATVDGSNDGASWTPVTTLNAAAWHQGMSQTFTVQGAGPSGTPGTGAHRYWRVHPLELDASANAGLGCAELVWRITPGGTQQASGGTALAESSGGTATADRAYDGGTVNYWVSNGTGTGTWIGYDFGSAKQIAEIAYTCVDAQQIFTQAEVQSSDNNVDWSRAALITAAAWSAGSTQTFTVQSAAAAASARPSVFVCT